MKNGIKTQQTLEGNGYESWSVDGSVYSDFHRLDGPAIIMSDKEISWVVNGQGQRTWKKFQRAAKLSDADMLIIMLKYPNFDYL